MKSEGFPPISQPDAQVLILGSLPGEKSIKEHQYYAHHTNKFWQIVGALFGIPHDLPYTERCLLLTKKKVALWDVIYRANREGSADANIRNEEHNKLEEFFEAHKDLRIVGLNGRKAEKTYKSLCKEFPSLERIPHSYLPSSSGLHGKSEGEKIKSWRAALLG